MLTIEKLKEEVLTQCLYRSPIFSPDWFGNEEMVGVELVCRVCGSAGAQIGPNEFEDPPCPPHCVVRMARS